MAMMTLSRNIPTGSIKIVSKAAPDAIAYIYTTSRGKAGAVAYQGKRNKADFHYLYASEIARENHLREWFRSVEAARERRAAERAGRKDFEHAYQIGDVLYNTWGYDQTNVDFYQVVAKTAKTITIREIAYVSESTGHDTGRARPMRSVFRGTPEIKRVQAPFEATGKGYIAMKYGSLREWEGQPIAWSSYH